MGGFLNGGWRDGLAVLSGAGVVATFIGILLAKRATNAAREATDRTLDRLRSQFGQFILATAKRQLAEARESVDNKDWQRAAIRSGDLAEHMSQMAQVLKSDAASWSDMAAEFRDFEARWRKAEPNNEPPRATVNKWNEFGKRVAVKLDSQHGPLFQQPGGRPV